MLFSHLTRQLQTCAKLQTPQIGQKLHARIIKLGFNQCPILPNALLNMYAKCGLVEDAHHLFDQLPHRDIISWASILAAFNLSDQSHKALHTFPAMSKLDNIHPDHFIFSCLAKACASLGAVFQGKQVHAQFIVSPFRDDDVVKSSLVDMYAKCGILDFAQRVFDMIRYVNLISLSALTYGYARSGRRAEALELFGRASVKNLVIWTALISGFVQSGNELEAIYLFRVMREGGNGIADPYNVSSIIGASANLSALEVGKQIHGTVMVLGYGSNLFVGNALVNMYGKCSDVFAARFVFNDMQKWDVVSWTSIIVGLSQHGEAEGALSLYHEMLSSGVEPNEVTFVGLIYACSHAGLASKGRYLFNSLVEDYGIRPSLQHYTCLLDLLGRSGNLDEAENLIKTMPFEPDEPTWAALLSACKHHGKTQMGVRIADHLLGLKLEDPSTYILLSNIYASAGLWEEVSKVRKLMVVMEIKKEPGYSCIAFGKEREIFYAGETDHYMKDEILSLLKELDGEMRRRGYVPDASFVLHDLEQQEKEKLLFFHSERLAVAYGLLRAIPGAALRVTKNLRVCGDCHTVMKFISSIAKREIVLRDVTRFHHFRDGKCSCNDFW